ncbi:CBASS cGAMP-activated phospholipase [Sphingomonas panaciterrae]|jgi:predicted acylesterase/phospholipase RssA|uniref:CBASS cGAMP-activated phospholipase n=1 Tax=Sphingomonas panaciterrae TaxID=1462999 RepID=UPI0025D14DE8|nr:CBASS cGAMP-activated phospholipase [uncultured Sphingomonas sp.]
MMVDESDAVKRSAADLPRRILAIDGGGLKGALPAAFLAEMERLTGKRVVDQFDLIAGTSTGGIIALGLGLGLSAAEICRFYVERGPTIFDQAPLRGPLAGLRAKWRGLRRTARHVGTVKYEAAELRRALEEVFGTRRIRDSTTRLVIPAYDSAHGGPYVFKTAHHERFRVDHERLAVDAALATAAAPSFLPAHSFEGASHLLDGGIWANNPMGSAAIEAASILCWQMDQVRMLSLGCTDTLHPVKEVVGMKDVKWLLELMFQGQDRFSQATAKLLLGHPHTNPHLHRINPMVEPGFVSLDDASKVETLVQMGRASARAQLPILEKCFFIGTREPFVPSNIDERN